MEIGSLRWRRKMSTGSLPIFRIPQFDHRHLRRRQKADGRPPGSCPPTHMKAGEIGKPEGTRMEGKIQPGDQSEGKNLALMGMAG